MSDEPKPFLHIEQLPHGARVMADDRVVEEESPVTGWPRAAVMFRQSYCDVINAAVEQREARLVAILRKIVAGAGCDASCDDADCLAREARAALAGKGDYVPRAELEAEREKTRGLWAVLNDVVHEGGLASERAAVLMAVLGIEPKPNPIVLASWLSKQTHAAASQHNAALERVIAQTTAQMGRMRIEEHANGRGELRSVLVVDDRPHTSVWSRLVGESFMTQTTRHEGDVPYPWVG